MKYIKIENSKVVLMVNPAGGAYIDFHFKDMPLNPVNWKTKDPAHPPFMGHFLYFDRHQMQKKLMAFSIMARLITKSGNY